MHKIEILFITVAFTEKSITTKPAIPEGASSQGVLWENVGGSGGRNYARSQEAAADGGDVRKCLATRGEEGHRLLGWRENVLGDRGGDTGGDQRGYVCHPPAVGPGSFGGTEASASEMRQGEQQLGGRPDFCPCLECIVVRIKLLG